MPGIDGYQLLRSIRRLEAYATVPIVGASRARKCVE